MRSKNSPAVGITTDSTTTETGDDLVWGAANIGRTVGVGERKAFHLLQNGLLPAQKIGPQWVASRNALRDSLTIGAEGQAATRREAWQAKATKRREERAVQSTRADHRSRRKKRRSTADSGEAPSNPT